MNDKQKPGCLLCWPVILINLLLCFPLGLILMIVRILKNVKANQNANNLTTPYRKASVGSVTVPEDLINKGKEIEGNLKKELYCNKKDLPREIFDETKWFLLGLLLIIIAYIYMLYNCGDFGTGLLWTLLFISAPWPIYWNIIKRTKEVKESNKITAQWLCKAYQETFNTFVFSEYIERRLFSTGVVHSENDRPNPDNPECRKFYHYDNYYKGTLRYKYAGHEIERISGYSGFNFDNSIWKFGPFCYKVYGDEIKRAEMLFLSRKKVENQIVVCRKTSEYSFNDYEKENFKKYEMDNSRFNEKFDVYAQNSVELFKIFTPAYMEKVLEIAEKRGVGYISIGGECIMVTFDSSFPVLANAYTGYNVYQAVAYAENLCQYFMTFMEDISPIGI